MEAKAAAFSASRSGAMAAEAFGFAFPLALGSRSLFFFFRRHGPPTARIDPKSATAVETIDDLIQVNKHLGMSQIDVLFSPL